MVNTRQAARAAASAATITAEVPQEAARSNIKVEAPVKQSEWSRIWYRSDLSNVESGRAYLALREERRSQETVRRKECTQVHRVLSKVVSPESLLDMVSADTKGRIASFLDVPS